MQPPTHALAARVLTLALLLCATVIALTQFGHGTAIAGPRRVAVAATPATTAAPTTTSTTATTLVPSPAAATPPAAAKPVQPRRVAPTRVVPPPSEPDVVGRKALDLISYPWARLNVTIVFAGPRPDLRARSDVFRDHEEVVAFVRRSDTPRSVAINIAHELGHLIDYLLLTDADRSAWLQERGRPDAAWWTCAYCSDYQVGTGDFAEVFAAWQVGTSDFRSRLAPPPSPAQMQSLSRFFRAR